MDVKAIVRDFQKRLQYLYGDRFVRVILYGSFARGTATEHSDIDVLVVLKSPVVAGREIDTMMDIIFDMNLTHNVLLSVYPLSETEYKMVNSPLLLNVRKEGIAV